MDIVRIRCHGLRALLIVAMLISCIVSICSGKELSVAKSRATEWIIPRLDLADVSLPQVAKVIVQESKRLDPEGRGIKVMIRTSGPRKKLTAHLKDVPVIEALKYIAGLANTKLRFENDVFLFVSIAAPEPMSRLVIKVRPGLAGNPNKTVDVRSELKSAGMIFPKGSSATYNPKTQELTVVNTEDQLDLIRPHRCD
jgi:hypothetical protein